MKNQPLVPAICGIISGTLSATLMDFAGDDSIYWFPGAVFGVVFALFSFRTCPSETSPGLILRHILFVGLSTLAYRVAVEVFEITKSIQFPTDPPLSLPEWALGICAGFTGSLILAVSIRLCAIRPSLRQTIVTVVLGSAFGTLIGVQDIEVFGYEVGALILYVPWQTAVFLALSSMRSAVPPPPQNG